VIHGSVTSVGVAYSRSLAVGDLARRLCALFDTVLVAPGRGGWPLRFVGGGDREVRVELEIRAGAGVEETAPMLEHFLGAEYGELPAEVHLADIGAVRAVLRPETAVCGLLLDLPDAALYPLRDHRRHVLVGAAIRELMLAWFDASPFEKAFADHEAEFHVDPLEVRPDSNPYALLALPAAAGDGPRLDFHAGGWPLAPGGV